MNGKVNVMIVDDHDMVRMGLKTYLMLEPTFHVMAEAANGQLALDQLRQLKESELPDLILMDLMMPVMNGAEATQVIMSEFPGMKIVMLTSFLEDDLVVQAIEAGAVSYVLKTVSAEELIYALQGVNRGMPVMTGDVSQALTRGIRQRTARESESGLTDREKEVLLLIAEGNQQRYRRRITYQYQNRKTHVSNLLMKCEMDDRTQLAIYAHRQGWVKKQS